MQRFELRLTVGQDDVDALEHVSNVRVVDWMNRAAVEHSRSLGYSLDRYRELGGVFVVHRHEIDYLASAVIGDELVLTTWPSHLTRSTAERRHEIRRVADKVLMARGLNQWVFVSFATGRPIRIPAEVATAFDPARFT